MQDFDIEVTHSCGHTERHTGATASGDTTNMVAHMSKRKCSACRPTCGYCHRTGDRENMLLADGKAFCNDWCYLQSQNPTHYAEHNDVAIPGFLRHWTDTSWHNDVCGSSMYTLVKGQPDKQELEIRIWVERADPADRDDPDSNLFTIEFLQDGDSNHDALYAGNDAAIAALWAHAAEAVASGAPPEDDIADMVLRIHQLMKSTEVK